MIKPTINSVESKSKALVCLEYILLVLCICVIVLRTTFTEGPTVQSAAVPSSITDSLYGLPIWRAVLISSFSMFVSTALIFSFVTWIVLSLCSRKFSYRLSGIETGLLFFCVAAVISGIAAPDKRGAINNFTGLAAPILMTLLLVQILDSQTKIKLILVLIVALGMVSTYRCWEQYTDNEHLIKFYEQDPDAALTQHRIAPNSLEHFQFEHRLYSKDISGFFTTSNSAGSFAMMGSFAAIVLLIGKFKKRNSDSLEIAWLIMRGIGVVILIFGLVITKSKGAIIASVFAATMFVIYLCFGNRLKAYKKTILIGCLLLGIAGIGIVVQYGLTHGRLPGGNSMLVRWQYWNASAKMYGDHLFTGVGPGNFSHFYPHYKPASASESVADPHNFLLSILTQYGPVGLIGFLAMICIPLWTVLSGRKVNCSSEIHPPAPAFKKTAIAMAIIVSAILLLIRPIIFPLPPTTTPQERQAGIIILYIMPLIIFIAGLLLSSAGETSKLSHWGITIAALFCAVLGVVFHNLIDFAIFEPGVFTVFWVIIACMIVIYSQTYPREQVVLKPAPFVKILTVAGGMVFIVVYLNYVFIPVSKTSAKIQLANRAIFAGRFEQAYKLLDGASEDDSLSSDALSLNSKLYLHHFKLTSSVNRELLLAAEKKSLGAIERNRASFKNYERLTEVYTLLADISKQQEKIDWLNKAYENTLFTVENLYPGCARLRIELAKVSDLLGKTDTAISQYEKAIEIEDEYRAQFREMYPKREEIVSRLGDKKYLFAKQRIKDLRSQPAP
ncbi:MAG: O-antigen ligase family protein [Planctomycetes bacterium]|nr:O-antigen ligase family protein [Planctomycetota bacterium]